MAGSPTPARRSTDRHLTDSPSAADAARRVRLGVVVGIAMSAGAALSFGTARHGILVGFGPADLAFLRFATAGAVFLPFFLFRWSFSNLAGIGWGRGLALTFMAGPLFAVLNMGGFALAPLAHGAVLAPMSVTLFSMILAVVLLKERLGAAYAIGMAAIMVSLVLIGGEGLLAGGPGVWIGDLLFVASSVLWTGYTILIRHWRVPAVPATAAVAVLSCAISLPLYVLATPMTVLTLPPGEILIQVLVQGLINGALAIIAYNKIVALLGASRAVLFPALVPGLAILFGIPLVGEIPTLVQLLGLVLANIGLLVALKIIRLPGMG
jgi:drug/metabolite transporter (DMT)-like permease